MEVTPKKKSWFHKTRDKLTSSVGATFSFILRVLLPFLFGIILNALFALVFLTAWLVYTENYYSGIFTVVLFGIFLVGFPLLYFWLARGYALKRCLEYIYDSSDFVTSKVIGVFTEAVIKSDDAIDKSPQFVGQGIRGVGTIIKKLDIKVPRAFQWTLSRFFKKIPIRKTFQEIGNDIALDVQNLSIIKERVELSVDNYIKEEIIGASKGWFWFLVVINLVAMTATCFFLVGI